MRPVGPPLGDTGENRPAGEVRLARLQGKEFEKLVRQHQARILRLALGMLRDRDAAEDVAQETFLRAFKSFDRFRNGSQVYTWLYRIAVNLCVDLQRKAKNQQPLDQDEESEPADPTHSPEEVFGLSELAKDAEAALNQLSPNHRAILLLREVEELSYEEISQVLGIPKGTVMSRLFHARTNLQRRCRRRGLSG